MSAIILCNRILKFWFGEQRWQKFPNKEKGIEQSDIERWFYSTKEFDEQIKEIFENDLIRLMNNEYCYPDDFNQAEHILACIILLDQFSRNIYRYNSRAFAFDDKAREFSQILIQNSQDQQLPYVERVFCYLPFEHSENLNDQNIAVEYMRRLYDDASKDSNVKEDLLDILKKFLNETEKHREIIQKFGRFPHRNEILNRISSEIEQAYLTSGGSRFGQ